MGLEQRTEQAHPNSSYKMRRRYLIFIILTGLQQVALAECEINRFGEVYCGRGECKQDKVGDIFCSKYQFGDALLDELGNVVCGKGQCLSDIKFNDIYCSSVEGGGANRDRSGAIKCYGGCEKASALMCESEKGR